MSLQLMDFNKKKVFITGSSRGIGLSIAKKFKNSRAIVIGSSRNRESISDEIFDDYFIADFQNDECIEECAAFIKKIKPDILINNVGINKISKFTDINSEDFLKIQKVNLYTPFLLTQAAVPHMIKNNWGRILSITSIWGKVGKEHRASYSSSKFGLDGLTLAIALEHAKYGIIANSLAPGFTDTDLTRKTLNDEQISNLSNIIPIKRMAETDEISEFALWLCSEKNTYITGQNISIDGGFSRS